MREQEYRELQNNFPLKLAEPEVSPDEPWGDDALDRQMFASALTNLVQNQSTPLTISLHGDWGTGKTFLLKRWREDLEKNGFKTIYFNAWEDDFCDDPFVAIIGQLSRFLEKEENYKEIKEKIQTATKDLLKNTFLKAITNTTGGMININEALEQFADKTLDKYSLQHQKKNELRDRLKEMSTKVKTDTQKPLIFIIDELDRCRPTFAIELLERVKHIFDIPDMVFVFGINYDELCSAIKSVYGKIDTDVYLRRFFDMVLRLPEPNINSFCDHMIGRYQLEQLFPGLSRSEFVAFARHMPHLYHRMSLSLRDTEHCIRSIAFVGKNARIHQTVYPYVVGTLIVLRLKNPTLYKRFIEGRCHGADIMNYINEVMPDENPDENPHDEFRYTLCTIETYFYLIDGRRGRRSFKQLLYLITGKQLSHPEYLSKATQTLDEKQEPDKNILEKFKGLMHSNISSARPDINYISSLIELTELAT